MYNKKFHTPTQERFLDPYTRDNAENVKQINKFVNLFTNFNYPGSSVRNPSDELINIYAQTNTPLALKSFAVTMPGFNTLSVGPGCAIMNGVSIDITGTTEFNVTSADSWFNIDPLNQIYPPDVSGFSGSEFDGIVSLYKDPDAPADPVQMFLAKPTNYQNSFIKDNCLPLSRVRFYIDGSNDVTSYEVFDELWNKTDDTDPSEDSTSDRDIKYTKFPFSLYYNIDGGYPYYDSTN